MKDDRKHSNQSDDMKDGSNAQVDSLNVRYFKNYIQDTYVNYDVWKIEARILVFIGVENANIAQ